MSPIEVEGQGVELATPEVEDTNELLENKVL